MKKILTPLALGLLLGGCATIFGQPESPIVERERVTVCFRQGEQGHVIATIRPEACYSMRCAKRIEASGTAVLDRHEFRIDFETNFHFAESKPLLLPCTEDCLGAGELIFDLDVLDVGIYDVYVWDDVEGSLRVTSGLPWVDQCIP